jgi:cellulose synthase/poly-beta-1,6-N-acetylglucosamine synthase-like glycosyltransferase
VATVFQLIEMVLLAIAFGLLVPIGVLFVECIVALVPPGTKADAINGIRPRIAVVVPAHNEEVGIGETLKKILPELTDADRLIVIADNCTDGTAAIARNCGATVVERQDLERRGKGYALDYGMRFIAADPPEVVVMIDADCIVDPGTIDRIARQAMTTGRPVQATYLMEQPANPNPKDAVSSLALLVKNLVRPQGLATMGLPCLLGGTGMAFPWSVIREAPLASGNIVEDMQLGLDLAIAGHSPIFCSQARVTGVLPQQNQAAKSQRTRWEHGHLQTLIEQVPRLLKESIAQKRSDLLALALELSVPPLSLLVILWLTALGCAVLAARSGLASTPAILLAAEGLLILVAIVGAWAKFGRAEVSLLTLLAVPFYVLWKIPLYLAFLVRPQTKWIRTSRDRVDASES